MTNNPTVDGVSRDTATIALRLITRELETLANGSAIQRYKAALSEIRALMDAPVVERQPLAFVCDGSSNHHGCPDGHGDILSEWLPVGTEVYTEPPEVAALQSTIAQLQARIAELGSGRVEADAWALVNGNGQILDLTDSWGVAKHWDGIVHSLYFAPTAPVAVADKYDEVLLPFLSMMRNELHANAGKGDRPGWLAMTPGECLLEIYYHLGKLQKGVKDGNELWITEYSADVANMAMMLADICGCLDATAALNGVRK